jgi:hypothetical protein
VLRISSTPRQRYLTKSVKPIKGSTKPTNIISVIYDMMGVKKYDMPTQEFIYKVIYAKFRHSVELCEDEYMSDAEKLWVIRYLSMNMMKWMENEKLVTKDSEPETPSSE